MTYEDVPAVDTVTAAAFHDLDVRTRPADWPTPEPRSPARSERWQQRLHHIVEHDGPGCWVAEDDSGEVVGVVAAILREGLWCLSTYAVRQGSQTRGVGKQLLDAALGYAASDSPGFICSSHDPRAVRRYRLAGFDLHPSMVLWGTVDRSAVPALPGLREGGVDDLELLDEIDRLSRGAGHGVDHPVMVDQFALRIIRNGDRLGYAYLYAAGGPYLLGASDIETAALLMWASLAEAGDGPIDVDHLTSQHGWAIDVGLRAGLQVHNRGYLALRGMSPPPAYIPSGHFL